MLVLANTFFFFTLLPFISPITYGTDIQPIGLIIGIIIIFLNLNTNSIKISIFDVYFFFLAILSYLYLNNAADHFYESGITSANNDIKRQFGLSFALIIFVVSKNFLHLFKPKIFYAAIYLQTFFAVINLYFPSLYNTLVSNLIRSIKIDFTQYEGFRGASALTPEPSYLAGSAVAYFCLVYYFWKNEKVSNFQFIFIVILCMFLLIISKSTLGILLLILIAIFLIIELISFKSIVSIIFLLLFMFVASPIIKFDFNKLRYNEIVENSRGLRMIQKATEDGIERFFQDPSLKAKVSPIYGSLLGLNSHPFGSGLGGYPISLFENNEKIKNDLGGCYAEYELEEQVFYKGKFYLNIPMCVAKAPSAFGLYVAEFGYLFLILVFLIIIHKNNDYFIFSNFIKALGLLFILSAFSITFPLIWLILAILNSKNIKPIKSKNLNLKNI